MVGGTGAAGAARQHFMGDYNERVVGALLLLIVVRVDSHGTLNLPESRNGAQGGLGLRQGGRTQPWSVAYWFTDQTHMVGNATIADDSCPLLTCFQCDQGGCAGSRLARTPWRAPGTAHLADPCGATLGPTLGRNASITHGTDLPHNYPYMPPRTQAPLWRIGGVEEVAWGLAVNHGGGYSYRLCPRLPSVPLTEACFQRNVLAFVGNTTDIVGARGEVLYTIPAARTTAGTTPAGSEWTRNPIPDQHDPGVPPNFPPPVPGLAGHCCDEGCPSGCGDGFAGGQPWSILDRVRVPSRLAPGDYVLSWRWDCEELPQVWTNCADVRLAA